MTKLSEEFTQKIDYYFKNPSAHRFEIVVCRYNDMTDADQKEWEGVFAHCVLHWAINIYKLIILEARKRGYVRISEIIDREKQILLAKIDIWIKFCNPLQENNLLQLFMHQIN